MARPTLRIFLMTTAGVLFAGGVAAAATGNNSLSPLLDVANDSGPTTTVVADTADITESLAGADYSDGLSADEIEALCAEIDPANHGEAVSAVAHDAPTGANHGEAVSAMAQSDCGKTDEEDEESEEEDADATEVDASDGLTPEEIEAWCAEIDPANHGEAVSTVAKDKSSVGAQHGAAVSAMAQSDCGKDSDDDGDDNESQSQSQSTHGKSKKHNNGELGS